MIESAIAGVKEVWTAVIASSATTVLVFTPIFFVEQEAGQLYSDIAITVSASILASMLFALFVVPSACAFFGLSTKSDDKQYQQGKIMQLITWLNDGFQTPDNGHRAEHLRNLRVSYCVYASSGIPTRR